LTVVLKSEYEARQKKGNQYAAPAEGEKGEKGKGKGDEHGGEKVMDSEGTEGENKARKGEQSEAKDINYDGEIGGDAGNAGEGPKNEQDASRCSEDERGMGEQDGNMIG
jgi:hypothetical protein